MSDIGQDIQNTVNETKEKAAELKGEIKGRIDQKNNDASAQQQGNTIQTPPKMPTL